jgi:hypothetical protein
MGIGQFSRDFMSIQNRITDTMDVFAEKFENVFTRNDGACAGGLGVEEGD